MFWFSKYFLFYLFDVVFDCFVALDSLCLDVFGYFARVEVLFCFFVFVVLLAVFGLVEFLFGIALALGSGSCPATQRGVCNHPKWV